MAASVAAVATAAIFAMSACSPTPYAPPARFAMMDSPVAPVAGKTDVTGQIGATGGPIFGPSFEHGGAALRSAVSPSVTISVEGQILHLEDGGGTFDHDAYAGRVGVAYHDADPQATLHGAVFAGAGGGVSAAAGSFASVDAGAGFAGAGRIVRPFLVGDVSYNAPIHPKQFEVSSNDEDTEQFSLHRDVTLRGTLGLELGPREYCALLGLSLTDMVPIGPLPGGDADTNPTFVTANIGFRAQL